MKSLDTDFSTEQRAQYFQDIVQTALKTATSCGASDAVAEVSTSKGLAVSVRKSETETVEQTQDQSLSITVYDGQKSGSASTSDLSPNAIAETVRAAWHIAQYTAQDEAGGLPDAAEFASEFTDLDLYRPWGIDVSAMIDIAVQAEQAAFDYSTKIKNSEGASVDTLEGQFILANSRGFMGGYPYTRHSFSVLPIAGKGDNMQRDYWYTTHRHPDSLDSPQSVGRYAAQRTVQRLNARRLSTRQCSVLFEAPLAIGLLGALVQATSGGSLYRNMSFLQDSLAKPVIASHISIYEDPFVKGAMGSSVFDNEGVKTHQRQWVLDGILNGYFLSNYTARKLNMPLTGNAGGSHNLYLTSSLTKPDDSFDAMLKKMGTGLLVTELIGQGVNYVTGDYSRGAFGYWVENGEIQYPVEEITIAGNLKDMLLNIVAVGADVLIKGSKSSGSILIDNMSIAGSS